MILASLPDFSAVLQTPTAHISLASLYRLEASTMSRKTSTARREAFFRALAETGNQTLAAERAKIHRAG
jgi:hypothetical protein